MNEEAIAKATFYGDSVIRCLCMSWQDANEYRSVKQNAGQRKSLIETAIRDYLSVNPDAAKGIKFD